MGTHQADPSESVLPQLVASASVLVHARSCHRRLECLRVSFIEQSLGGNCCRFCVPRCTGTDTASPNCHCCRRIVCCSSRTRGSGGLDFEPERFGRCSVCTPLFS